jgi:hypothetical protein
MIGTLLRVRALARSQPPAALAPTRPRGLSGWARRAWAGRPPNQVERQSLSSTTVMPVGEASTPIPLPAVRAVTVLKDLTRRHL